MRARVVRAVGFAFFVILARGVPLCCSRGGDVAVRARKPVLVLLVSLCVLVGSPVFGAVWASAVDSTHVLSFSFGSPGSGAGQVALTSHSSGVEASSSGIAVNTTTHD